MPAIFVFALIVIAIFLAGTVLAYPLQLLASLFGNFSMDKAVHFSILLTALACGLAYLVRSGQLACVSGLPLNRVWLQRMLYGCAGGAVLLLLIEAALYGLGMRQADPDLSEGALRVCMAVLKAVLTGLAVGVSEEYLYRGAIYTGLARYAGIRTAVLVSAVFYGAVHFIDFNPPPGTDTAGVAAAFRVLLDGFDRFADPLILDSLLSLSLLGLLLALVRLHTGSLPACIGVHAGIVAVNKFFAFATDYRPGSPYAVLVNTYDHLTGHLASVVLAIACGGYFLVFLRRGARAMPGVDG